MGEVDPAFIQPLTQISKSSISIEPQGIPLIDLSLSTSRDLDQLVSEIGSACKQWGFFLVINHGVPPEVRSRFETATKEFFNLSVEEKKKVKRDEFNAVGYHDGEHTKNVRDWKEVFIFLVKDPTMVPASYEPDDKELRTLKNPWPQFPLHFREACQEYAKEVEKLAFKLMELISLSLGLEANRMKRYFKEQTSMARLNHYPPCPFPHLALGVGPHKDTGALTVLAQDDVGGLEVKRKSDGEWVQVKPVPHAFVINVGDVIQVWSNDAYHSVEHRVKANTEKERFSIPLFLFPSYNVVIKPFEELVSDKNPAKFREYSWGFMLPEIAVISRSEMWSTSKLNISGFLSN